eukprot:COSAG01_NODE_48737_length_378_cov_1.265233_1_plen_44_part_01
MAARHDMLVTAVTAHAEAKVVIREGCDKGSSRVRVAAVGEPLRV